MTKVPQVGKVKTRLTPPLTPNEATALNTCFLRDVAAAILDASWNKSAVGMAVYTPRGGAKSYKGILPKEIQLITQRGINFGDRLRFAAADIMALGFESVCLIGSDSPTVPPKIYQQASQYLARAGDRIVLGPANDGGYYLIGLKSEHDHVFERIDWSTDRVLTQTRQRAAEIGVQVELLPSWYDVDDRATLSQLCEDLFDSNAGKSGGYEARHTRSYLSEILRREGRSRIWPND